MTSDAKVGLLLGLLFIFIIAFIINGLPAFHADTSNNELTTNMVNSRRHPGIGANERDIEQSVISPPPSVGQHFSDNTTPAASSDTRFRTNLPPSNTSVPPQDIGRPMSADSAENSVDNRVRIYTVRKNDNLAKIAKKFYGPELGNKKAVIQGIYHANKDILDSPDEVQAGENIVIPPLWTPGQVRSAEETKEDKSLLDSIAEKVKSIGRRHNTASAAGNSPHRILSTRIYVVKKGDSLWKIAESKLGNPSRYKEILKLNSDKLNSKNTITAGMRLRLPQQ